jgi:hypothetical protein
MLSTNNHYHGLKILGFRSRSLGRRSSTSRRRSKRRLAVSRCDGTSAVVDTDAVTTKTARTRERKRSRDASACVRSVQGRSPRDATGPGGHVFGLIRLGSSTFIGIQLNAPMQVPDVSVIRRTNIPNPEYQRSAVRSRTRHEIVVTAAEVVNRSHFDPLHATKTPGPCCPRAVTKGQ